MLFDAFVIARCWGWRLRMAAKGVAAALWRRARGQTIPGRGAQLVAAILLLPSWRPAPLRMPLHAPASTTGCRLEPLACWAGVLASCALAEALASAIEGGVAARQARLGARCCRRLLPPAGRRRGRLCQRRRRLPGRFAPVQLARGWPAPCALVWQGEPVLQAVWRGAGAPGGIVFAAAGSPPPMPACGGALAAACSLCPPSDQPLGLLCAQLSSTGPANRPPNPFFGRRLNEASSRGSIGALLDRPHPLQGARGRRTPLQRVVATWARPGAAPRVIGRRCRVWMRSTRAGPRRRPPAPPPAPRRPVARLPSLRAAAPLACRPLPPDAPASRSSPPTPSLVPCRYQKPASSPARAAAHPGPPPRWRTAAPTRCVATQPVACRAAVPYAAVHCVGDKSRLKPSGRSALDAQGQQAAAKPEPGPATVRLQIDAELNKLTEKVQEMLVRRPICMSWRGGSLQLVGNGAAD